MSTLAVGLVVALLLRQLPTVRLQLAGLALLAVLLPLSAVLLSGWVMFHMGDDVKILERGCEFGYQKVADFPRLKITFWAPTIPKQGDKDVGDPVLGVWKAVTIKRDSPKGLEMGDCELVELFRDRVLPKFLTRDLQGGINCIPHQLVGNRIDLRFEVLTGVPALAPAPLRDS